MSAHRTIWNAFSATVESAGARIALKSAAGELSFAALKAHALGAANAMHARGLRRDDVVVINGARSLETYPLALAALRIGALPVVVNLDAASLDAAIAQARPRLVFTNTATRNPFGESFALALSEQAATGSVAAGGQHHLSPAHAVLGADGAMALATHAGALSVAAWFKAFAANLRAPVLATHDLWLDLYAGLANGVCVALARDAAQAKALGATVFVGEDATDAAGFDAVFQVNASNAAGVHRLFCHATGLPLAHANVDAPAGWLGVALPELEAVLLDETGRAVLPGQIGALYFAGAALPLAAAGDTRFVQDPRTPYRAALMHTGLSARVSAQGEIALAGAAAPVVRAPVVAAPIVVETPRVVEAPVAVEAPKAKAAPVAEPQPTPSLELVHDAAPASADNGAYEEEVAAIWRDILGIQAFDKTENFFFLGGTSLLLIRVHAALQTKYERKIPIEKMFENPNVAAMAAFLADDAGESAALKGVRARAARRAQALNRMRAGE